MTPTHELQLTSGAISAKLQLPGLSSLIAGQNEICSVPDLCQRALANPLGFPELTQCVVPGDRVVITVDPETPFVADLISAVWEQLQTIPDGGVTISLLLPQDNTGNDWTWMRELLPLHIQQQISVHVHNPADSSQISYIASSAAGERVYLNRLLSDADMIVTIGVIAFDGLLGFRGTSSSLYPAFSDAMTVQESRAQGHPELTPDQQRPYRELVDEIGWLLGTQFTVQIVPGSDLAPAAILAGLPDDVLKQGKELVTKLWRLSASELVDGVVLSIPGGAAFGWKQLGQALDHAANLVHQGGRIIAVADLVPPEGPAATMLRRCQEPEDLLKPLRKEPTYDSVEISQLIQAARRARIYLLSPLPADIVEELGMIPVADSAELQRLVSSIDGCRVIPLANYVWCEVTDAD
jgi:nickel-dependent lactate racemase